MKVITLLVVLLTAIRNEGAIAVLPFLELSDNASVFTGVDDSSVLFEFSVPFYFNSKSYSNGFISSNGLISFGSGYIDYIPQSFPLSPTFNFIYPYYWDDINLSVISPYWDDINLSGSSGNVLYEVFSAGDSVLETVSDFINSHESLAQDFYSTSVVIVYWSDVCNFGNEECSSPNSFQAVLASDGNTSYAVFTYKCGMLNWVEYGAAIGYSAGDIYANHYLSRQSNVNDIACLNQPVSPWSNVVYRVNDGTMYTCSVECNPRSDELQYEQCCSSDNIGKFFQVVESGIPQGYIVCPDTLPDWCE